jgi:ribosomal protein L40E
MTLKNCRECGGQVGSGAAKCPHCGTSNPAMSKREHQVTSAIVAVLVLALVGVPTVLIWRGCGALLAPSPPPTPEQAAARAELRDQAVALLSQAQAQGAIARWDVDAGKVWMEPAVWAAMDRDGKADVLCGLGTTMEAARGLPFVRVLSYRDDSILGEFDGASPRIVK